MHSSCQWPDTATEGTASSSQNSSSSALNLDDSVVMNQRGSGCRSVDTDTSDYYGSAASSWGGGDSPPPDAWGSPPRPWQPPAVGVWTGTPPVDTSRMLRNFTDCYSPTGINRQHVMLRQASQIQPPPPSCIRQPSSSSDASSLGTLTVVAPTDDVDDTLAGLFDAAELAEMRRALFRPKKVPDANYTCHICYRAGEHLIYDCPKRHETGQDERTPYQGPKKCFGEYACPRCKRRWNSGNSFANMPQFCVKCKDVPVYPRKQLAIDKAVEKGALVASSSVNVGRPSTLSPAPAYHHARHPSYSMPSSMPFTADHSAASRPQQQQMGHWAPPPSGSWLSADVNTAAFGQTPMRDGGYRRPFVVPEGVPPPQARAGLWASDGRLA